MTTNAPTESDAMQALESARFWRSPYWRGFKAVLKTACLVGYLAYAVIVFALVGGPGVHEFLFVGVLHFLVIAAACVVFASFCFGVAKAFERRTPPERRALNLTLAVRVGASVALAAPLAWPVVIWLMMRAK